MYKLIYLARRATGVSREDWPRTWRSHAVFASKFPALEAEIAYMRYCNRIDAPTLDGNPCAIEGLSPVHDGVAIAAGDRLDGLNGTGFGEEDRAKIDQDELRVFDMPTPNFTYYCTEAVLRDGKPGEAALFRFLARKPEMTRDQFDLRVGERHAEVAEAVIAKLPTITRYVNNRPVHEPLPRFPFDTIAECWFASAEDAVRALSDDAFGAVTDDLGTFCDLGNSVTILTSVCHRWPKD